MQTATGKASASGSTPATGSSLEDASFAGLLASAAASQIRETSWNDDELAADVATISYERALRIPAHLSSPCDAMCNPESTAPCNEAAHSTASKPLKTASITIRLAETECAQLRRRAAEAGMTISAYLRSCTLEVENLRAQVKQALAELRCAPAKAEASQSRNIYYRTVFTRNNESATADPSPAARDDRARASMKPILIPGQSTWLIRTVEGVKALLRRLGPRQQQEPGLNPANPFAPVGR